MKISNFSKIFFGRLIFAVFKEIREIPRKILPIILFIRSVNMILLHWIGIIKMIDNDLLTVQSNVNLIIDKSKCSLLFFKKNTAYDPQ